MSTDVIPLIDIGQWREQASIIECSELFGNFPTLNCMVVPCSVSPSVFSKQTNDDPGQCKCVTKLMTLHKVCFDKGVILNLLLRMYFMILFKANQDNGEEKSSKIAKFTQQKNTTSRALKSMTPNFYLINQTSMPLFMFVHFQVVEIIEVCEPNS